MAKVYIVGAGPGDMELLTLKGKRCVEEADVIVYDRLVNKRILSLAKDSCELIYMGKKNTEGGLIQDKINATLVEKALKGKVVTRLKGGDPFVFGRGGEEILELVKNKISFEEVPGITSSISVPAYAGIPVTHRGISKSFHIFTGHTEKNGSWHNFEAIAKLKGTLIFLMGVKNLNIISNELLKNGKNPNTPVAIIEKGSSSKQRVIKDSLKNIYETAQNKKVVPPAIIIIGDVVNLRDQMKWFESRELFGKKIAVTRDKNQSKAMSEIIDRLGGETSELPFIEIEDSMKDFNYDLLSDYSCLLFNSSNGVRSFFDSIDDMRKIGHLKIGAVGVKTVEELKKYRVQADFVPEKYMISQLVKESQNYTKKDEKILILTSDISPSNTKEWSSDYQRTFSKVTAYKTKKKVYDKDYVVSSLEDANYITFLSSSTVEAFIQSIEGDLSSFSKTKFVSIGPVTSKTMLKYNMKVALEAKEYTANGVIEAIKGDIDEI